MVSFRSLVVFLNQHVLSTLSYYLIASILSSSTMHIRSLVVNRIRNVRHVAKLFKELCDVLLKLRISALITNSTAVCVVRLKNFGPWGPKATSFVQIVFNWDIKKKMGFFAFCFQGVSAQGYLFPKFYWEGLFQIDSAWKKIAFRFAVLCTLTKL